MTEHQFVRSETGEIQIEVVANPIRADVVDGRINHPRAQRIDLNLARAEVMFMRARQWDMQRSLVEIVLN